MQRRTIIIGGAVAALAIPGSPLALGSPPENQRGPVPGGKTIRGKTNADTFDPVAYSFEVTRRAKIVARLTNTSKPSRRHLKLLQGEFLGADGDSLTPLSDTLFPGEHGRVVRRLRPGRYFLELDDRGRAARFKFRLEPASAIAKP
jgi:hypothetical protein